MPRKVGDYNSVVAFYNVGQEFDWMANTFRNDPVIIDTIPWPTTEQYFQAQKFTGNSVKEQQYRQFILDYLNSHSSLSQIPKDAKDKALELGLQFTLEQQQEWD